VIDISDNIELKNSKSNSFGWSQHEIWHDKKHIGWIESGGVDLTDDSYAYEKKEEADGKTHLYFFVKEHNRRTE